VKQKHAFRGAYNWLVNGIAQAIGENIETSPLNRVISPDKVWEHTFPSESGRECIPPYEPVREERWSGVRFLPMGPAQAGAQYGSVRPSFCRLPRQSTTGIRRYGSFPASPPLPWCIIPTGAATSDPSDSASTACQSTKLNKIQRAPSPGRDIVQQSALWPTTDNVQAEMTEPPRRRPKLSAAMMAQPLPEDVIGGGKPQTFVVCQTRFRSFLLLSNSDATKCRLCGVLMTKTVHRYCCTAAKIVRVGKEEEEEVKFTVSPRGYSRAWMVQWCQSLV